MGRHASSFAEKQEFLVAQRALWNEPVPLLAAVRCSGLWSPHVMNSEIRQSIACHLRHLAVHGTAVVGTCTSLGAKDGRASADARRALG